MTADQIEITVRTRYLPGQSEPEASRYAFAYTITIRNRGDEPVQLLYRHWLIVDGNNKELRVSGAGVVGETPVIAPGAYYEYTSGTQLDTAVGIMQGSYDMVTAGGVTFSAPIPPFSLALPGALH
jgi:ApaG protein